MAVGSCDLMVQDFGIMTSPRDSRLEASLSFKEWQTEKNNLQFTLSFNIRNLDAGHSNPDSPYCAEADSTSMSKFASCQPELFSPRSDMEPDAAAVKLQKVYKSYRTRRNLADCAVVVEELWWKALDYASLSTNSVSFFDGGKSESTVSRWARARKKAAKVGKGLSKDEKAQKLALRHWLEAIDPRHRYGHNLSMYYDLWFRSESTQPFFYWLDIGDGKELNLERCPRNTLQQQCIEYLGPKARETYEVIVRGGKLIYRRSQQLVNTTEGSKWIFVLSTCRKLYIGQKRKGRFQHSSFLAGAATTAAGRLVAKDGIVMAIWPYSGHYLPTEENFLEFISFLMENNVDLTNVKKGAVDDDDDYSSYRSDESSVVGTEEVTDNIEEQTGNLRTIETKGSSKMFSKSENYDEDILDNVGSPTYEFSNCMPFTWATGAGPRIGCVRDYPADLQAKALEQVSLSHGLPTTPTSDKVPIPSPRPSHILMLSPRIACMGIPSPVQSPRYGHFVVPSPRVSLTLPVLKKRRSEEASTTNH